ncbi:MAG: ABC transporter substrate-binding protein [Chloroflexota bacterium]|nr:ABC transporter substrate-binding protein [Chloroflexota bacterium]
MARTCAAALLLALVTAACGGNGEEEPTPTPTPEATTTAAATEAPQGPVALHIGAVLPETGSLAFLGVPIIAAARLAVEDVNAQGGEVTFSLADSATNPATGLEGARRLLGEGAHVIVGAAASAVSQAFIQTLFDEQVPQCSPSNTSPVFTGQENAAYYIRTVPPDTAMAPIIADVVVSGGATRIAIIGRADAWGNALERLLVDEFDKLGANTFSVLYDPETASYSAEVAQVVNYAPDIVINLGFSSDGSETVRQLIESGIGPERQFAATGLYSPTLWESVDASNPSVLDGMRGISQTAKGTSAFKERLAERAGDYLAYGAEAYDCVILLALAARLVGDPSDGEAMMAAIAGLTHDGEECTSYGECAALIDEGKDIDYSGVSGPINFSEEGDPTVAVYSIHTWENGGNAVTLGTETVDLAAE